MDLLGWTRLSKSVSGQKDLVDIVADQIDLNQEFNASDEDQVDRLIYGLRHALPFFSVSVKYGMNRNYKFLHMNRDLDQCGFKLNSTP